MDTNIDTENADVENIIINGNDGLLVLKNGIVSVAWSNGQKIFVIHSQLSKDELMRVAENVKFISE